MRIHSRTVHTPIRLGSVLLSFLVAFIAAMAYSTVAGVIVLGIAAVVGLFCLASSGSANGEIRVTDKGLTLAYRQSWYPMVIVKEISFAIPWGAVSAIDTEARSTRITFRQTSMLGGTVEGVRLVDSPDFHELANTLRSSWMRAMQGQPPQGSQQTAPVVVHHFKSYRTMGLAGALVLTYFVARIFFAIFRD